MTAPGNVKAGLSFFCANILNGIFGTFLQISNAPPELHRSVMVIGAIFMLFVLGFIGYKMMKGSNLFRIINAAMVVAVSVSAAIGFGTSTFFHPAGIYLYWIGNVISICVVVLLFTPSANSWFSKRRVQ